MGNSQQQLRVAQKHIEKNIGAIIRCSSLYQTAAWGKTDQPDFLNQVIIVETSLTAAETMQAILSIEKKMGRLRTEKNAPRIIDIDILFFNDEIIDKPHLTIPHPEIHNRKFALIPMDEIAPGYMHPVLKSTIKNLLSTSTDTLEVKLLDKS